MSDTQYFTASIHLKGWEVREFLKHIGRSENWYYRNCKRGEVEGRRLSLMISGIEDKANAG